MNSKIRVLSIISLIYGLLVTIGGFFLILYNRSLAKDIEKVMDDPFGFIGLLFGGIIWIAVLVIAILALFIGIFSIVSAIFGFIASDKNKRWAAITLIVLNGIIVLLVSPLIFSLNPLCLPLLAIPVLYIIFCAIFLRDYNRSRKIPCIPQNPPYPPYYYNQH